MKKTSRQQKLKPGFSPKPAARRRLVPRDDENPPIPDPVTPTPSPKSAGTFKTRSATRKKA